MKCHCMSAASTKKRFRLNYLVSGYNGQNMWANYEAISQS